MPKEPKRILVISPYSGDTEKNLEYLDRCLNYVIARGHAPFAPHFVYPHFLDDTKPEEREKGIRMGLVWGDMAQEIWVFRDKGTSSGMQGELTHYFKSVLEVPVLDVYLNNPQDSTDA